MNFSRKVILASCACAAFLSGIYSCTVDDLNVEEKELFLCKDDNDCLSGSRCGGVRDPKTTELYKDLPDVPESLKNVTGTCILEKDVKQCSDYDGDGYSALDPIWRLIHEKDGGVNEAVCGTESNPVDPDDTDPRVNAKASEICDGKDNNGDGCIDGKCMCDSSSNCDCNGSENQKYCEAITERCLGKKSLVDMKGTGCSAENAGAFVCIGGDMVYAKSKGSASGKVGSKEFYTIGDFQKVEGKSACPAGTSQNNNGFESVLYNDIQVNSAPFVYVDNEKTSIASSNGVLCDGLDHDCNGRAGTDEEPGACLDCNTILAGYSDKTCIVSTVQNSAQNLIIKNSTDEGYQDKYSELKCTAKSEASCACIGHLVCLGSGSNAPTCVRPDGTTVLNFNWLKDNASDFSNRSADHWCDLKAGGGSTDPEDPGEPTDPTDPTNPTDPGDQG